MPLPLKPPHTAHTVASEPGRMAGLHVRTNRTVVRAAFRRPRAYRISFSVRWAPEPGTLPYVHFQRHRRLSPTGATHITSQSGQRAAGRQG